MCVVTVLSNMFVYMCVCIQSIVSSGRLSSDNSLIEVRDYMDLSDDDTGNPNVRVCRAS